MALPSHLLTVPGAGNTSQMGLTPGPAPRPHLTSGPGGALFDKLQADRYPTFQRIFRTRGTGSLYSSNLSRSKPYSFTLGQMVPPKGSTLIVTEYRFRIYRYSGIQAGLSRLVDGEELTTYLGVKFVSSGQGVPWNMQNELSPAPATIQNPAANPIAPPRGFVAAGAPVGPKVSPAGFANAFSNQSTQGSTVGSALLPFDSDRVGDKDGPFSVWVSDQSSLELSLFCFRRLPYPIAFFEMKIAGYTLPQTEADRLRTQLIP